MSESYKVGDEVLYSEDGGEALCKLLAYTINEREEGATLKILKVIEQPRIGGEYKVGDEFPVWHRTDMGGWGGDWRIRETHSR